VLELNEQLPKHNNSHRHGHRKNLHLESPTAVRGEALRGNFFEKELPESPGGPLHRPSKREKHRRESLNPQHFVDEVPLPPARTVFSK
jgi:hypothetical protein